MCYIIKELSSRKIYNAALNLNYALWLSSFSNRNWQVVVNLLLSIIIWVIYDSNPVENKSIVALLFNRYITLIKNLVCKYLWLIFILLNNFYYIVSFYYYYKYLQNFCN